MIRNSTPKRKSFGDIFFLVQIRQPVLSSLHLKNLQSVFKHLFRNLFCGVSAVNLSLKTVFDKLRNPAYVVNVSVSNKQKINGPGIIGERNSVFFFGKRDALNKTAINKNFHLIAFHKKIGTGNLPD